MNINLVSYTSSTERLEQKHQIHEKILNELEISYHINYYVHTKLADVPKDIFTILFIASGGVEHLIVKDIEQLPKPVVILADGLNNSLPAALEVATWMRQRGIRNEILHGDINTIKERINTLGRNYRAQLLLKQEHVGIIGTPSPWLLSSGVDYYLVKQRWGLNFVNIPIQRAYDYYNEITKEDVFEDVKYFKEQALGCKNVQESGLINAMRFYKAIRRICDEDELTSIAMNCYKPLEDIGVTSCLANSLLNNEGILTGCEGDLQALFTLMVVKAVTDQTGFMCNPNSVDVKTNQLILGHCSVATNEVKQYIIRDHYSNYKAISIQGLLPLGESTLLKCAGECLDEYFVSPGSIIDNTNLERSSRTEVLFKQDKPVSYFLKNPLGNHHILVRGNHEKNIIDFLEYHSCKRVF